ncbi:MULTISPECIES: GlxA family transcriptional regulator [unclassified Pseudomonas]|uniref:GlxA family transcriptional regulator n=1 Tax=unclassified Pseudomonas TaxID=196821 RepID=UPI0015BB7246|nr:MULTISPECIES: GlxA family transcriptional regulator [unclassified Pseudomonas]MCS4248877.1 transcriptional regulator GlxA family with amidase domain [Pseudomonas sp. BIGb0164]NWE23183.1 GlxA family transcriptional regulator [Pseudomonas sp. P7548]
MVSVGILLFPGFQMLSLSTSTVFEFANLELERPFYRVDLVSEFGGPVKSSMGFAIDTVPFGQHRYDTLLVVGDNEVLQASAGMLTYLQHAMLTSRRVTSACTGSFHLAAAGLLDGRKATTHWYHARAFRQAYPNVKLEEDRIFTVDGPLWTSAGLTACLDLALALVEHDLGVEVARAVARKLVIYHRRAGGQSQFSALLEIDPKSDRVQSALVYARQHLQEDLSVDRLAEVAHLSPRQFSRLFHAETGQTPAKAIERLRIEAARLMLESGDHPIDIIARDTGFGDPERMRRAFLRAFGQPPQMMRRALQLQA